MNSDFAGTDLTTDNVTNNEKTEDNRDEPPDGGRIQAGGQDSARGGARRCAQPAQRRRGVSHVGCLPRGARLPVRHNGRPSPAGNPQDGPGRRGQRGLDLL